MLTDAGLEKKLLTLDTSLDRLIHRPVARKLALLLQFSKLTPNQLTILSLLPAFASGWFFLQNRFGCGVLGVFCYYVWAVLDHTDGELARLKCQSSEFGKKLDDFCDTIATNSVLFGIFFGFLPYWNEKDRRILLILFFAGIILSLLSSAVILKQKRHAREVAISRRQVHVHFVRVQKILDHISGRDPIYLMFAFVLAAMVWTDTWISFTMGVFIIGLFAIPLGSFVALRWRVS